MSWSTRRKLEKGCAAWRRGELDVAAEWLGDVLTRTPAAPEAVFPHARLLHEQGQTQEAIARLTAYLDRPDAATGGATHLALIRFDTGDDAELEKTLAPLGTENHVASALRQLAAFRASDAETTSLPAAALWNSEIAGRYLALLEARYTRDVEPADDAFHHRLYSPAPPPSTAPAPSPTPTTKTRAAWEASLERAFAERRFADFLSHREADGAQPKWISAISREYWLYAQHAVSSRSRAVQLSREAVAADPSSFDLHFLHGLSLVRGDHAVAAAHAFVRAARLNDIETHQVLTRLETRLREGTS